MPVSKLVNEQKGFGGFEQACEHRRARLRGKDEQSIMNRVVVTGLGVCASLGKNTAEFSAALQAGKSAIKPLTIFGDTEGLITRDRRRDFGFRSAGGLFRQQQAAALRPLHPALPRRGARGDRAKRARIPRQRLRRTHRDHHRLGCRRPKYLQDENYQRSTYQGLKRCHPLTIPKLMINVRRVATSRWSTASPGRPFVVASACSSANHAIGVAFPDAVRSGMVDAAVTGGTEAVFTFGTIRGWEGTARHGA